MKPIKVFLLIIASLFFSSCANYISQMHREFDRADGTPPPTTKRDKFSLYRQNQMKPRRNMINSSNNPYVVPSVKRSYKPERVQRKRFKARDLADSGGDGSLWSGNEGRNNFLFTENRKKSNGDIILLKVGGRLKNEITAELKRAFPSPVKKKKKDQADPAKDEGKAPASTAAAGGDDKEVDASTDQVYDRISSVVVEEINQDHILLRGRKNVLYKNRKRVVEVQALISRRDIANDDTVHSNRVLESQVTVLR